MRSKSKSLKSTSLEKCVSLARPCCLCLKVLFLVSLVVAETAAHVAKVEAEAHTVDLAQVAHPAEAVAAHTAATAGSA